MHTLLPILDLQIIVLSILLYNVDNDTVTYSTFNAVIHIVKNAVANANANAVPNIETHTVEFLPILMPLY